MKKTQNRRKIPGKEQTANKIENLQPEDWLRQKCQFALVNPVVWAGTFSARNKKL